MDYVYCYLSYYGYKAGAATMNGFWDEMDRLGKDRNPYRAGFLQFVGVAESRDGGDGALRGGRPSISTAAACTSIRALPRRPATTPRRRSAPASRARSRRLRKQQPKATARTRSSGGTTGTTAGSRFNMVAREMEDIVERGYVIVGSPKEVIEQLEHVATTLNVGHLMMLLQYGNMSQGADQVQHQAVRREGDAGAVEAVPRMGGQVVAEADGAVGARNAAVVPAPAGCCGRIATDRPSRVKGA